MYLVPWGKKKELGDPRQKPKATVRKSILTPSIAQPAPHTQISEPEGNATQVN